MKYAETLNAVATAAQKAQRNQKLLDILAKAAAVASEGGKYLPLTFYEVREFEAEFRTEGFKIRDDSICW